MKKIDLILTMATSLNGVVVQPSDKPVPIDEKLAAQLIANGRAKLVELPVGEAAKNSEIDTKVSDAESAATKRIETANEKAEEAEKAADKRIEKANERVGLAEIEAKKKIDAIDREVKAAENEASNKTKTTQSPSAPKNDEKNQGA